MNDCWVRLALGKYNVYTVPDYDELLNESGSA